MLFYLKKWIRHVAVFSVACLFTCCRKDQALHPVLFVSPDESYLSARAGDLVRFEIESNSESKLVNFTIIEKPEKTSLRIILDTSISTTSFRNSFEYIVPSVSDSSYVLLEFNMKNESDLTSTVAKKISILPVERIPVETSGHEFYSKLSGKEDAYDLNDLVPRFAGQWASELISLRDETFPDSLGTYKLSRYWTSPAGLNFVRFNEFNYASATSKSIKQSYDAAVKKIYVNNISVGDIILSRLPHQDPDSGYVAIKLIYVIDADSTHLDRYIFNLKK